MIGRYADQGALKTKKAILVLNLLVNFGILGFFKYFNFFVASFIDAFAAFGITLHPLSLHIILPVGVSFYTFQAMGYSIDVYRGTIKPTRDIVAFFAFVSFFPQLVAGPIERATNLLPQFFKPRRFDYAPAVDGMRQMLWGFFKKVVIADNCARGADAIFNNFSDYSGTALVLGVLFFAFQIYGDFSGYSDIAIGAGRLFGINLMRNFAYPYFSRDIAEFWRRWHISLSTWFRDYVYIPLGGSRGNSIQRIRNTFIIFILSGLWHGANWTFVVWGALNAVYFLPLLLTHQNRKNLDIAGQGRMLPSLKEFIGISVTFILTLFAWIFFRSESVSAAGHYIAGIFQAPWISIPRGLGSTTTLFLLLGFVIMEWIGRESLYAIARVGKTKLRRWCFYYILIMVIYFFGNFSETIEFIYFQF